MYSFGIQSNKNKGLQSQLKQRPQFNFCKNDAM